MRKKISLTWLLLSLLTLIITIISVVLTVVNYNNKNLQSDLGIDISSMKIEKVYDTENNLYFGTTDGFLYCYSKDSKDQVKWSFEKKGPTENDENPPIRDIKLYNGKVYVAYETRLIYVFNAESGAVENVYRVGNIPNKIYFNDSEKDFFLVYCDGMVKEVYILKTADVGTESAPAMYDRTLKMTATNGLQEGFKDAYITESGEIFYTTNQSTIRKAELKNDVLNLNADPVYTGAQPFVGITKDGEEFVALSTEGEMLHFNADFDLLKTQKYKLSVSTSFSVGTRFFVKLTHGGIVCLDTTEGKLFSVSTAKESLLIMATNESFGYLSNDGGAFNYFENDRAISSIKSGKLFIAFLVVAIVFFIVTVFFGLLVYNNLKVIVLNLAKRFFKAIWRYKFVYIGLIPTFVLLAIFYYYPIVWGLGLAFFDYTPGEVAKFVGFRNIVAVINNSLFWSSSVNMIWLLITDLLKALIPPFIFAECIMAVRSKTFSFWVRVLLFIPGILPGVAGTLVWANGIFGSDASGLLNGLFSAVFPSYINQSWLQSDKTALFSLIMFAFPWIGSYLIFYGAIMGIPPSLFEAAKLDGCGWFKKIFIIDIPMILPQFKYIFITSFIASVQDYGRIFVTTGGDFGTSTPALMMYLAIYKQKSYGIASAMGLFIFLFLMAATSLNFKMQSDQS